MSRETWTIRGREFPKRELLILAAAMAAGLALRLAYVVVTHNHVLNGDEPEYDIEGRFIAAGHWFWSKLPYGIPHASMNKAPGYPLWVGTWYTLLGEHPDRVLAVQTLLGPVTIFLTWVLARRLFGPRAALAAACIVAVYPLAWQFEARLYAESLATPLTLLVLIVFLGREPTRRRAAATGALIGVSLLIRPSALFLLAGVAVAWWSAAGLRRGTAMAAVSVAVAVLVVAPWTYRNHRVAGGFIPISLQDAAAYGTFNDEAAHDKVYPYAWRPGPKAALPIFFRKQPLSDLELRSRLQRLARDYIRDHPESLPKAFFWNGLSRLWDVRRPARAMHEVQFEGRTKAVTATGLAMYYVLLPLALVGLWRWRRRREIVLPILALALAASVVFTPDSGTRYRATLEPLIVILACAAIPRLAPQPKASSAGARAEAATFSS